MKRNQPELDFQRQVVQLAELRGWDWMRVRPAYSLGKHFTPTDGTLKRWPDLTLVRVRDRRLIFAELKSDSGYLSPEQKVVIEKLLGLEQSSAYLDRTRVEVHVWRPRDLDRIQEILA